MTKGKFWRDVYEDGDDTLQISYDYECDVVIVEYLREEGWDIELIPGRLFRTAFLRDE